MLSESIRYIGVNDHEIDLFEGQYDVPAGMSYNSWVILDDKVCVTDTVDRAFSEDYLANLDAALDGRAPDYLVVHHVEPDHASSVRIFLDRWPGVTLVGNAKTFQMLENYFDLGGAARLTVKEGDTLPLGTHTLRFITAPMVHWPEVMMSYEESEKLLFSADAFGQFGALDEMPDWDEDEAARYYFNIVGKYGPQVQAVLKKAAGLDIAAVLPLHGPVLSDELPRVLACYSAWSAYTPDLDGVFIAYASLHGNTAAVAERLADIIDQKGCGDVFLADLNRVDPAEALTWAFRFGKVVLCASTYNAGVMPFMEDFIHHLKAKNWQKRTVGLVENGSWAPMAAKVMRELLSSQKELTVLEPAVTVRGALKTADLPALEALADALLA
ncbi:MAG: FprA family A-type flavoprotein [Clostridia bacterium]|nr:FprA family A-type flavoprotein [Clostridia bacterium]